MLDIIPATLIGLMEFSGTHPFLMLSIIPILMIAKSIDMIVKA